MTDGVTNPLEPTTGTTIPTPSDNPFEDLLGTIKNEKGEVKYEDVPTALKALDHSQQHIGTLEQENASVKAKLQEAQMELEKRKSVEDVVKSLTQPSQNQPVNVDPTPNDGLDEEKVLNLVKSALTNQREADTADQNLKTVVSKLSEKFGDNTATIVGDMVNSLGTTAEELQMLSKQNPNLVLKLFDAAEVKQTPQSSQTINVSRNTIPGNTEPAQPSTSLIRGGASTKDIVASWKEHGDYVKKELGIES